MGELIENITFMNAFLRTPTFMFWDKQSERLPKLLPHLIRENVSVVGLAEIFRGFEELIEEEASKYNFETVIAGGSGSVQTSGLVFLYDPDIWKVLKSKFHNFKKSSGFDSLADKGYLVIQTLHYSGVEIYFIVTHLNSDSYRYEENQKAQLNQLKVISRYINRYLKNKSVVIMGDFNIDINAKHTKESSIKELLNIGDIGNTIKPTTAPHNPNSPEVLDYIIVRNLEVDDIHVNKSNKKLSDHYAISRNIYL